MKRFRKIVIRIISIGLFAGGLALLSFIIYLETSIDKVMTTEQQEILFEEIRESQRLPDSYYKILNTYYPAYFEQGVWGSVFSQLTGGRRDKCHCREIYIHPGHTYNWLPFTQEIVALELEEKFSQQKCYEYNMSVTEFGSNTRSIQEAARLFYHKEIAELNEREVLELSVIQKAPTQYSPFRNRKNLDKAVDRIMENN